MTNIDEMIEVMQAYRDGETVELSWRGRLWEVDYEPVWDWVRYTYRIAPDSPDSIDWSHVADEYKYLARDEDGSAWLFSRRPEAMDGVWGTTHGNLTNAENFKSYKRGTIDWRESLVERPE